MVLNKKGNIFKLWFMVILFNIFLAISFTFLIGFNNMATTEIMDPIHNEINKIAQERTSTQIQDSINQAYIDYKANTIPWDLVIFGLMINFYFFLIYSAIKTRKASPFIVFSMLTFGSIFILFLISISIDVQQWILTQIYANVFEDLSINTPIMDFVFANIGIISFIMALTILLINQFDRLKKLVLENI